MWTNTDQPGSFFKLHTVAIFVLTSHTGPAICTKIAHTYTHCRLYSPILGLHTFLNYLVDLHLCTLLKDSIKSMIVLFTTTQWWCHDDMLQSLTWHTSSTLTGVVSFEGECLRSRRARCWRMLLKHLMLTQGSIFKKPLIWTYVSVAPSGGHNSYEMWS